MSVEYLERLKRSGQLEKLLEARRKWNELTVEEAVAQHIRELRQKRARKK